MYKKRSITRPIPVPKTDSVDEKITIPEQNEFEVLETKNILFYNADDNYTEIYLKDNKKKLVSKTLKYIEEAISQLILQEFTRVIWHTSTRL